MHLFGWLVIGYQISEEEHRWSRLLYRMLDIYDWLHMQQLDSFAYSLLTLFLFGIIVTLTFMAHERWHTARAVGIFTGYNGKRKLFEL
jgi:hypothetical protein